MLISTAVCGRRGGSLISAVDSEASGSGSLVFSGETLRTFRLENEEVAEYIQAAVFKHNA